MSSTVSDQVVKAPFQAALMQKLDFIGMSFFPADEGGEATGLLSKTIDNRRYEPGLALYTYEHNLSLPANVAQMDTRFSELEATSVVPQTSAGLDFTRTIGRTYAFELQGKLMVNNGGDYVFALNTSAPADVYIDNKLVASAFGTGLIRHTNSLQPSANSTQTTTRLTTGLYDIRIRYFSNTFRAFLKVLFRNKNNKNYGEIPCGSLFYDPALLKGGANEEVEEDWDAERLIQNLADYEQFIRYFSSTKRNDDALKSALKTYISDVYVSNQKKPFVTLSGLTDLNLPSDSSALFTDADVNFSGVFARILPRDNGNYVQFLVNELNRARVIYNFLDPVNMEKFNNKRDITIPIYTIHQETMTHDTIQILGGNLTDDYSYLKPYLTLNQVQQFITRRIVLLMDLLIHVYTSFFIYEMVYMPAGSAEQQMMLAITKFLLNKLVYLNTQFEAMYQAGDGAGNSAIIELYNKINLYKSNAAEINTLNDTIRDSKSNMLEEEERLTLENQQYTTTKTASLVTVAFSVLFVFFFAGIAMVPMESTQKRMYAMIGLVAALVFCIIVYFVRKYKIEAFTDGAAPAPSVVEAAEDDLEDVLEGFVNSVNPDELQQYLRDKSAIAFERYLMEMSTLDHFARYLQNTINLALILQTSQTYNNINYSTSKELAYFNNTKTQVDNAAASLKSRHRLYDLESKKYRAGMMLAIALVFIIGIMTTLYVLEENNVKTRQIIGIVGIVAIILSIMGYFLEIQSRVRTNADKYYWGKPSSDLLQGL